jgi:hypothetical protein
MAAKIRIVAYLSALSITTNPFIPIRRLPQKRRYPDTIKLAALPCRPSAFPWLRRRKRRYDAQLGHLRLAASFPGYPRLPVNEVAIPYWKKIHAVLGEYDVTLDPRCIPHADL